MKHMHSLGFAVELIAKALDSDVARVNVVLTASSADITLFKWALVI